MNGFGGEVEAIVRALCRQLGVVEPVRSESTLGHLQVDPSIMEGAINATFRLQIGKLSSNTSIGELVVMISHKLDQRNDLEK
jgi:hypothetical protein